MKKKSKYALKKLYAFPATEKSKTAQYANPRHAKPTKAEKRLLGRIKDYNIGPTTNTEAKVESRWKTGGFHKPGSLQ